MLNFRIEKIFIGDTLIDELTDEEGTHWYPLKRFLESVLCKYDKVSKFRDSIVSRYMQVINYPSRWSSPKANVKTWCINENGIKYLLRKMDIFQKQNKNITLYRAREKGFFEACRYFHVTPPEKIQPLYINIVPKLNNYDIWSLLCIKNDVRLKVNDRWKLCNKCGYYYPDKVRYFGKKNKRTDKTCLQCQGKNFKCHNKIIQFIYDNDGIDLLYEIERGDDKKIATTLRTFIEKEGIKNEDKHC